MSPCEVDAGAPISKHVASDDDDVVRCFIKATLKHSKAPGAVRASKKRYPFITRGGEGEKRFSGLALKLYTTDPRTTGSRRPKMMMTFISRGGEGRGDTSKESKATKSEGRCLEEGASRALMRQVVEEGCGGRGLGGRDDGRACCGQRGEGDA